MLLFYSIRLHKINNIFAPFTSRVCYSIFYPLVISLFDIRNYYYYLFILIFPFSFCYIYVYSSSHIFLFNSRKCSFCSSASDVFIPNVIFFVLSWFFEVSFQLIIVPIYYWHSFVKNNIAFRGSLLLFWY